MKTPILKCSVESAQLNRLPVGFVLIVKGDRVKKDDLRPDGMARDEWKEVPPAMIGEKVDGSVTVVRRMPGAPAAREISDIIREKINGLEMRRDVLRAEIDTPPTGGVGVYYFTDRLEEVRMLSLMIDAIRQLA